MRGAASRRWRTRVVLAVVGVNVVLIVTGISFAPATLTSPKGVGIVLADIGMQALVAVLALGIGARLGLPQVIGTCLGVGALFAAAYDGLLLADFAGHPLALSPYALFIATAAISSLAVAYRTGFATQGVLAAIWALLFGTAAWSAGFMVMAYARWDTPSAYGFWLRDGAVADFNRSGATNFGVFVLQDIQGAVFFHPILSIILGLVCGTVFANLGRLAGATRSRRRPTTAS